MSHLFLIHVLIVIEQQRVPALPGQFHDGLRQLFSVIVPGRLLLSGQLQLLRRDPPIRVAEPSGAGHVPAGVHGDPHQPGFLAALAPELWQRPPGLHESLLHGILRRSVIAEHHGAHMKQRSLILRYQAAEFFLCVAGRALFCNHRLLTSFTHTDETAGENLNVVRENHTDFSCVGKDAGKKEDS